MLWVTFQGVTQGGGWVHSRLAGREVHEAGGEVHEAGGEVHEAGGEAHEAGVEAREAHEVLPGAETLRQINS